MKKTSMITFAVIAALFLTSWVIKGMFAEGSSPYLDGFLVTLAAFLTLAIMSFLYKDNPFYKFAEHVFGVLDGALIMHHALGLAGGSR